MKGLIVGLDSILAVTFFAMAFFAFVSTAVSVRTSMIGGDLHFAKQMQEEAAMQDVLYRHLFTNASGLKSALSFLNNVSLEGVGTNFTTTNGTGGMARLVTISGKIYVLRVNS